MNLLHPILRWALLISLAKVGCKRRIVEMRSDLGRWCKTAEPAMLALFYPPPNSWQFFSNEREARVPESLRIFGTLWKPGCEYLWVRPCGGTHPCVPVPRLPVACPSPTFNRAPSLDVLACELTHTYV